MTFDARAVQGILFDYGCTVIEFTRTQVEACDAALADVLERRLGPFDRERFDAQRHTDRTAPYTDGYHESRPTELTVNLVRTLYDLDPPADVLEEILQVRFDAFVACIARPPGVAELLGRWRERYRLGLVSNYPDGAAIRASLARVGLAEAFDVVVVSGDVGRVKPHPLPFRTALEQLDLEPAAVVHVGDNWLADVQGAKRLGMQAIWTRQWPTPEPFAPEPGDPPADGTIDHLNELEQLL